MFSKMIYPVVDWLSELKGCTLSKQEIKERIVLCTDTPKQWQPPRTWIGFDIPNVARVMILPDVAFGWKADDVKPSFIWPPEAKEYYRYKWSLEAQLDENEKGT